MSEEERAAMKEAIAQGMRSFWRSKSVEERAMVASKRAATRKLRKAQRALQGEKK